VSRPTISSLTHVLLTKLNLPMKDDDRHLRASWIIQRLELLERLAAPSVSRQSRPFHYWFLLCAADTASGDKRAIEDVAARTRCAPLWIADSPHQDVPSLILAHIPPTRRLLTSRLDSDDVLHVDFARTIRQRVADGFVGFINPAVGLQYAARRLYLWPYLASNFISYVEDLRRESHVRTVLSISHDEIYDEGARAVRQIISTPLWLVVTHDLNTSTWAPRGIRVGAAKHRAAFPVLDHLGLDADPPPWRLAPHQVRDLTRLAIKAGTRGSRPRVVGAARSLWTHRVECGGP
jgi:Putative rhamnosyl transferase